MSKLISKNISILFILLIGGIGVLTFTSCSGGGGGDDEASSSSGGGISSTGGNSSSGGGSSSSVPSSSSVEAAPKCGSVAYNESTHFCDKRDGVNELYKVVKIGTGETAQTWMAKNLNYAAPGSKCGNAENRVLTEDASDCAEYGRLYDWSTAMGFGEECNVKDCVADSKHQGVCPEGWHLPSDADWNTLVDIAGGDNLAGTKLKAKSGWYEDGLYIPGTDNYGFSALPGGGSNGMRFDDAGSYGNWWSSARSDAFSAYVRGMGYHYENVSRRAIGKALLLSVRCLKDD